MLKNTHVLNKIKTLITSFTLVAVLVLLPVFSSVHIPLASATEVGLSYSFEVRGGDSVHKWDERGRAILHAERRQGRDARDLDASMNNSVAELPVGTIIFLRFPSEIYDVNVSQADPVLRTPRERYYLPRGVVGVLEVMGHGTARISVKHKKSGANITNSYRTSAIWSGYARDGSAGEFSSVSSYWIVPAATCSGGNVYSGSWIGIDGSTNTDLIQAGTESSCDSDGAYYRAWWEILPAHATFIPSCTVSAGDKMYAEIKQVGATTFHITLKNLSRNIDCSPPDQNYTGPRNSVEWITERPLTGTDESGNPIISNLANYGSATFTNNTVNGANASHDYSRDAVTMVSDEGNALSVPSLPNDVRDALTTFYCDPNSNCPAANPPENWTNTNPTPIEYEHLTSIDAEQGTVWATGWQKASYRLPIAYRYANGSWNRYSLPYGGYTHYEPKSIASASNGDAWIVGACAASACYGPIAYRWSNNSWARVPSDNAPAPSSANKLAAVDTDRDNVPWAVGRYHTPSNELPLMEKWNGTKFAYQTLQLPNGVSNGYLSSISFGADGKGWAVGEGYTSAGTFYPLFFYYDGTVWTGSIGQSGGPALSSVSVGPGGDAWAVGSARVTQYTNRPVIMHFVNGVWIEDTTPVPYPSTTSSWNRLKSVKAVAPTDVWVAGYYEDGVKQCPLVMHYDGSTWKRINTPPYSVTSQFTGVGFSAGVLWTAGSFGGGGGDYPTTSFPYVLHTN